MVSFSFGKEQRLLKRSEYVRLFEGAERVRLKEGSVFRKLNDKKVARLGISVKKAKTAVFRNRLKRGVRNIFRTLQKDLGHYDYHVVLLADRLDPSDSGARVFRHVEKAFRDF